jgi:hypothetical protein
VRLLEDRLQGVMPQIFKERPDIVPELLPKLFAFPSEILAKTLKGE